MDPYTPAQLAAGTIKRGILRLLDKYPFHAKVLEKFLLVASPSVGTMGVSAAHAQVNLHFDPAFVLSLPPNQLGGVLLHEVHHVLFRHITMDPAKYPDQGALTVACEVTVNEFIHEPLPPGGVFLNRFPTLPPLESTEQRYCRLAKMRDRINVGRQNPAHTEAGNSGANEPSLTDNHEIWRESTDNLAEAEMALTHLVQEAALEAGGVPPELLGAMSRTAGTSQILAVQALEGDAQGRLNWKTLLRRYTGQVLESCAVYYRPPRRYPHLLGILPGRTRIASRAAVVAIIDTSGSIDDECLEAIDGELAKLDQAHTVHVVESDSEVRRVYRYKRRLATVAGRGGTDFRPALDRTFLQKLHPDLVIYFTDGEGPAPETAPRCPLIWCLVPGGEPPAPWGRVIRMERNK